MDKFNVRRSFPLKKIYEAVDRFCARHPRFGISNLMLTVVIGNVVVYLLQMFAGAEAISFLSFNLAGLLRGELWRIVTFVFVPGYGGAFSLLISLYFYYWIGSTLERQWGTAKFNLYYFGGVLLTVLGTVLASLLSGYHGLTVAGSGYVNLSMFLAFAVLFPNAQVLLFFIIPVKMKWLAWLDAALFALDIIRSAAAGSIIGVVLPIVALLNFAVFIWPEVKYQADRFQHRHSRQTVQFKKAVKQQQQQRGYHHKCCVCGKTDTDYPDMTFRYCSKCAGFRCYCEEHIFSHVHFTQE